MFSSETSVHDVPFQVSVFVVGALPPNKIPSVTVPVPPLAPWYENHVLEYSVLVIFTVPPKPPACVSKLTTDSPLLPPFAITLNAWLAYPFSLLFPPLPTKNV